MKKTKKLLAFLLTIAMLTMMVPIVAMAENDPPDILTLDIRGLSFSIDKETDLFPPTTVRANSTEFRLPRAELDASGAGNPIAAFTMEASHTLVKFLTAAADKTFIENDSNFSGGPAHLLTQLTEVGVLHTDTSAIVPGDVVWVASGTGTNAQFLRIVINQRAADGTIDGDATVVAPIINVVLPLDLDFALNPMEVGNTETGSQITTTDYRVANKSAFAVLVNFDIEATAKESVALVERGVAFEGTNTERNAFFAILAADSVAPSTDPTFDNTDLGTMVYDAAEPGLLIPFDPAVAAGETRSSAEITFVLAARENPTTLALNNAGVGSFQFFGELNERAVWRPSDIVVSGAYTLTGIRSTTFDKIEAEEIIGLNVYVPDEINEGYGFTRRTYTITANEWDEVLFKFEDGSSISTLTANSVMQNNNEHWRAGSALRTAGKIEFNLPPGDYNIVVTLTGATSAFVNTTRLIVE